MVTTMEIGAQLYTVRDFCKDLNGLSETLKRIADIGYKAVQMSGTCPYEAAWLKERLKENGLKCALTHTAADKLQNDTPTVLKEHDILDCQYIGLGGYDFSREENYPRFVEEYTPVMTAFKKSGKYFMYHNHDHEFRKYKGETVLAKLERDFPADMLGFTLDTFWVQAGGADPAYWLERLSGRVPCLHLKDFAYGRVMAVLGEGNIHFERVFAMAEKAGTKYMLVEQDDCNGEDPFACLTRSYAYLKSHGFQ